MRDFVKLAKDYYHALRARDDTPQRRAITLTIVLAGMIVSYAAIVILWFLWTQFGFWGILLWSVIIISLITWAVVSWRKPEDHG